MKQYLYPADMMLPRFTNDAERMTKWACIACDQYTSEPEYWNKVETLVGDEPSTLRVILPELYLDEAGTRIGKINARMDEYRDQVLVSHPNSMIYLERRLKSGKIRHGLVGAVDLEMYDYTKGATSLIRATEGTVLDRIPPRVKIREGAPIELPHIMILIDDPEKTVIEPLATADSLTAAYDFDLMLSGGHVTGAFLPDVEMGRVNTALDRLRVQGDQHPASSGHALLFAMGDGNHSLAAAKAYWEQLKSSLSEAERVNHPARYALAEIVNIHDEALEFEPIYRVVFGADHADLLGSLRAYADALGKAQVDGLSPQTVDYITPSETGTVVFANPTAFLPVGTLQSFLDTYAAAHPGVKIDYIHGVESVKKLAESENAVGLLFKGMEKDELFPTVQRDGALPRKTFSMGEADDKRFYLEARNIKSNH